MGLGVAGERLYFRPACAEGAKIQCAICNEYRVGRVAGSLSPMTVAALPCPTYACSSSSALTRFPQRSDRA
jgi:hypothetical protein